MADTEKCILVLPSIHFVMKLEQEALAQGLWVELIPTPKQISSDCGMAVEFRKEDLVHIRRLIADKNLNRAMAYCRSGTGFEPL